MPITAQFTADFSQWSGAVAGAQSDLDGLQKSADQVKLEEKAEAAGRAMADFGRQVVDVAGQFIESYAEEEAATARLETALRAQGTATDAVMGQYAQMQTQFQQTTRYSDDAIASAQALFVQVGNVGPEQMQAALTAATNLSAGLGISLEQATTLVAKAFATGGENLGRLKQVLADTVPKGADMAQVLDGINKKFGGQAQADAETYNGQMARLGNQLDDVKERMGGLLAAGLTPLLNAFDSLPGSLQTVIATVGVVGTALAPLAIAFGSVMTALGPLLPALGVAIPAAIGAVTAALTALAPFLLPAGAIIVGIIAVYEAFKHWDAIKQIAADVYNAVKTWLVDRFQAIVGWIGDKVAAVTGFFKTMYDKVVGGSYVPDMINGIQQQFGRLPDVMVKPAQDAANAVTGAMDQAQGAAKTMAGGIGVPGSRIEEPAGGMGQRYLVSPEGYRVPLGGTGYLPMNWWEMYTGKEQTPSQLNNWYLNPRPASSSGVIIQSGAIQMNYPIMNSPAAQDALASTVGDAIMNRVTRTGTLV